MNTVKVELELPKETTELAMGVIAFLAEVKKAVADGVQPADIAPVIASAIGTLIPALQGVEQLPEEFKADKMHFAAAFAYAGLKFADSVK